MPEPQAEILAEESTRLVGDQLATKQDIGLLRSDLDRAARRHVGHGAASEGSADDPPGPHDGGRDRGRRDPRQAALRSRAAPSATSSPAGLCERAGGATWSGVPTQMSAFGERAQRAMTAEPSTGLEAKLDGILARHAEVGRLMASVSGEAYVALAREFADLDDLAGRVQALRAARAEAAGLEQMLADPGLDPEMRALAAEELEALQARVPDLEAAVKLALLPRTRPTTRARSSRSGPAPAARRRRCSRATSTACTSAMRSCTAGASSFCRSATTGLGGYQGGDRRDQGQGRVRAR